MTSHETERPDARTARINNLKMFEKTKTNAESDDDKEVDTVYRYDIQNEGTPLCCALDIGVLSMLRRSLKT
jgi:hypothetical protein